MISKDFSKKQQLEKYSSAFTLSDMEIFIFPELFYSLVLANIMSPILWEWKQEDWFKGIEKKSFTAKVNRIKQFIMDKTVFNLDLETWGLTDKQTEKNRFEDFIDMNTLSQSNALFGYEGDKYYFKIDIRRHFGLDKFSTDIIPYWKTETIEAMMAFAYKKTENGQSLAAGECVSFSALYAAAMFVIGQIPLEKIFLIATPLHSQNFILEHDGLLTNNRRIVTKKMWYNGTELSAKARRAVENENITIVSHISGYIHTLYKQATISKEDYQTFSHTLRAFLETDLTFEVFCNFLKTKPENWECFEYEFQRNGKTCYIDMHTVFNYERSSKNTFANESRKALFEEMDARDFSASPNPKTVLLNPIEDYLRENPKALLPEVENMFFEKHLKGGCVKMENFFDELQAFIKITPKLPIAEDKVFEQTELLKITTSQSRQEIEDYLLSMRNKSALADYTLYTYRKMDVVDWYPFVLAAVERNPVCLLDLKEKTLAQAYDALQALPNQSIYDGVRLALPDEVWNFGRGDGLEKALVLMNLAAQQLKGEEVIDFCAQNNKVILTIAKQPFEFTSAKNISIHFTWNAAKQFESF